MKTNDQMKISRSLSVFQGRLLPEAGASLAGYSALIDAYELKIPLPKDLASFWISGHNRTR